MKNRTYSVVLSEDGYDNFREFRQHIFQLFIGAAVDLHGVDLAQIKTRPGTDEQRFHLLDVSSLPDLGGFGSVVPLGCCSPPSSTSASFLIPENDSLSH